MEMNNVLIYSACIILLFIFGRIFVLPLKSVLKLVFNSILGGLVIWIINIIGGAFNFHIGLNIVTSILIGILGIPGAILLIILKLLI